MVTFRVIEILSANTIRVTPQWGFSNPATGEEIVDDKIKIAGLNFDPNNAVIKNRLQSFLLNQQVELYNPTMLTHFSAGDVKIQCNVILGSTDIVYYFPELSSNLVSA